LRCSNLKRRSTAAGDTSDSLFFTLQSIKCTQKTLNFKEKCNLHGLALNIANELDFKTIENRQKSLSK